MPLKEWVRRVAESEAFDWPTHGRWGTLFLERLESALVDPTQTLSWCGQRADPFLWNIQHTLSDLIWEERCPRDLRLRVLARIPQLIAAACRNRMPSVGAFQFWESVLELYELCGNEPDATIVREAVFRALVAQIEFMRDKCSELSALHGLNHLRHEGTGAVIDKVLPLLADDDVRGYAESARRFERP